MIEGLQNLGINLKGRTTGQIKTTCPQCSHLRKKKNDPCLSVNIDEGAFNCWHCQFSGTVNSNFEDGYSYALKRGISKSTLDKTKVLVQDNAFVFPYPKGTKYRAINDKKFWWSKGGKVTPWVLNPNPESDTAYFTEGEFDALTLVECGYSNVINMPAAGAFNSLNGEADGKEVVIAVDNDDAGEKLRDQLLSKYPEARIVSYPEGCKDINDVLIKGKAKVKECIVKAKGSEPPILQKIKASKVSLDEQIIETALLLIFGEIVFTLGNFSCITGKAKSRKSFLITVFVLAYLLGEFLDGKILRGESSKNKIVVFDTEQARKLIIDRYQAPQQVCGKSIDNLEIYNLRPYTYKERIEIIEHVLYETQDLGLVIIDGIRDLIADFNSLEESSFLTEKLMKWSQELNIHIICVLHTNKGDSNVRGHLGTEIVNKAETTIEVTKDSKDKFVSSVEAKFTRGKEFESFAFGIDSHGLPTLAEGFGTPQTLTPQNVPFEVHRKVVDTVFSQHRDLSHNTLAECLKVAYSENGFNIGITKARDFKGFLIAKKLIVNTNEAAGKGQPHKYNKV